MRTKLLILLVNIVRHTTCREVTVVMDVKKYTKISPLLGNEKVYEKLNGHSVPKYKKNLVVLFTNLQEQDRITQDLYWHVYPTLDNGSTLIIIMYLQKSTRNVPHGV